MGPQHISLIVALSDHGSIGGAARALGKSQPAVTKALKQIEAQLGTPLFHRVSHGIIPTDAGKAAIERCRKISGDLRRLEEELHQLQGNFVGRIDLIVSPLAALKIVPAVAARFRSRFPKVQLGIRGGHAPSAFAPLRKGEVDFVIGPAPEPGQSSGLRIIPLFETPVTVLTGKTSKYLGVTDPEVLRQGHWLMVGPEDRRPLYFDFFESHGVEPPRAITTSDSILSIMSLIENSDLLCSFPTLPLEELQQRWELATLPLEDQLPVVKVALTTSKERPLTPAARIFADLVQELGLEVAPGS